jgi:alkylhydroperoxidase family enzyme
MARISRLGPDARAGADVKALFDTFLKERGNIPNMFRTVAHRPEILTTMLAHFRAVMGPGTVPVALKEMLAVRVSRLNNCDY